MTEREAAVLVSARAYRDSCLWTERVPHSELEVLKDAALALDDAPTWTNEPPTEPGWWWVMRKNDDGVMVTEACWIKRAASGMLTVRLVENDCRYPVNAIRALWWQRLAVPALPDGEG